MFLTKAVVQGLRSVVRRAHERSADLATNGKGNPDLPAGFREAIAWVRGLRAGQQVGLLLSPADAEALQALAERGWEDTGRGLGMTATQGKRCRRVLQALADARTAFDDDRLGRLGQPLGRASGLDASLTPDVSRRKFGPAHP